MHHDASQNSHYIIQIHGHYEDNLVIIKITYDSYPTETCMINVQNTFMSTILLN